MFPKLIVAMLIMAATTTSQAESHAKSAQYGQKVKYSQGEPLIFPEGKLIFKGVRHIRPKMFPPGFTYYDFQMTCGAWKTNVSWSSGTGVIAPHFFKVGGKKFVLELSKSEAFKGWLKDDELVLWRESDFKKLRNHIKVR